MPTNLEFMAVEQDPDALAWLQQTLNQFGQQNHITVKETHVAWLQIWRELVNIGIYRRGPDLTEVGTTWMESLAAMHALRPFSQKEVDAIGGESIFLPASWKTTSIGKNNQVWGIPFRADVRVIYYWKDLVEKAGIDPEKDFSSPTTLHNALKTLQPTLKYPWAIPTHPNDNNSLYTSASWIWAKGGDFISAEGNSVAFNRPDALEGWYDLFSLREFMPPSKAGITAAEVFDLFAAREIAACIGGPWILPQLQKHPYSKELLPRLGIALPPGPAFVGGSMLVIWEYTRSPNEAIELIRYLCKPEIQTQLNSYPGLLPVNATSWKDAAFQHPYYQVFGSALASGRPLPLIRLWGMIEERLTAALGHIWATLAQDPSANVKKVTKTTLDPLADRLNITLSS
jgi:multiple sugar transport system substrate-binding protein